MLLILVYCDIVQNIQFYPIDYNHVIYSVLLQAQLTYYNILELNNIINELWIAGKMCLIQ